MRDFINNYNMADWGDVDDDAHMNNNIKWALLRNNEEDNIIEYIDCKGKIGKDKKESYS